MTRLNKMEAIIKDSSASDKVCKVSDLVRFFTGHAIYFIWNFFLLRGLVAGGSSTPKVDGSVALKDGLAGELFAALVARVRLGRSAVLDLAVVAEEVLAAELDLAEITGVL